MTPKMLLTREDIIQALSNKDLKVALPKGFTLHHYKTSFFERLHLAAKNRAVRWFYLRSLKLQVDNRDFSVFGVEKDFETETDNKLYNGMILQLNEDMYKYLLYMEAKERVVGEIIKFLNQEE